MADESTIRAILAADSPLAALIGTRLWDQIAPTNQATPVARPFVTLTNISEQQFAYSAESPDGSQMRLQIDIYADNKASAKAVLAAIRTVLLASGYTGSEDQTQDLPADDPALRRISSDWIFVFD